MASLKILPEDALEDLRLQRTACKNLSYDEAVRFYSDEIIEYGELIARHVSPPDRSLRVLDIGCGIGFCTLAFADALGSDHCFTCLDRDERTEIFYEYHATAAAYNSLSLTRRVLEANGIGDATLVDAPTDRFPAGPFDVVMSALAYGFHFPIGTYLDELRDATVTGTRLIIDLRLKTSGQDDLAPYFDLVESTGRGKYDRCVWVRK
jgi:SAM-dependent methyltransferase